VRGMPMTGGVADCRWRMISILMIAAYAGPRLPGVDGQSFNQLGKQQRLAEVGEIQLGLDWKNVALKGAFSSKEPPTIIFGPPSVVRVRNIKKGFKESPTCPSWCFQAKLQDPAESNCVHKWSKKAHGGQEALVKVPYLAIIRGVHYIKKDKQVCTLARPPRCVGGIPPPLLLQRGAPTFPAKSGMAPMAGGPRSQLGVHTPRAGHLRVAQDHFRKRIHVHNPSRSASDGHIEQRSRLRTPTCKERAVGGF
jgi:hypothetical protein